MLYTDDCQPEHPPEKGNAEHWNSDVEIDEIRFTAKQVRSIRKIFREECQAFSKDEHDIGCAPDLHMNIELTDKEPLRRTYNSAPTPLHRQVKYYIIDLVNKGRIRKTASPY